MDKTELIERLKETNLLVVKNQILRVQRKSPAILASSRGKKQKDNDKKLKPLLITPMKEVFINEYYI